MKVFSYHTKMRLRKVLQVLGILALTGLVIWICWLVWLQRYVVYTREGVTFDFGRSTLDLDGKETGPQAAGETAPGEILFQAAPQEAQNLARLSGVYVDGKQLEAGLDQVSQKLSALESGTAVLLDVKSKSGQFYYTSRIQGAPQSEALDCAAMDKLIQTLKEQGCYLIARLPAFRDSAFAEAKPGSGLTVSSGALWTDEAQCHWLDPANQAVTANLIQICRELQERGFDEVVWTDFRIPDSGSIVFTAAASCIAPDGAEMLFNKAPTMLFMAGGIFAWFSEREDHLKMPGMAVRVIGKYGFSILLIHWYILHYVTEERLGLFASSFGVIGGTALAMAVTLILSLLAALVFDNTVVIAVEYVCEAALKWLEKIWKRLTRRSAS